MVRTTGFHPVNRSSILRISTKKTTPLLNSPEKLNEHPEESKTLHVTKVYPFGLFLEDDGFIHISKISDFHKGGGIFTPGELEKWYPVGSSVVVKLEKEEKTPLLRLYRTGKCN